MRGGIKDQTFIRFGSVTCPLYCYGAPAVLKMRPDSTEGHTAGHLTELQPARLSKRKKQEVSVEEDESSSPREPWTRRSDSWLCPRHENMVPPRWSVICWNIFFDKKVSISTGQTWTNPSDILPPLQPSWARKIETSSLDPEKLQKDQILSKAQRPCEF